MNCSIFSPDFVNTLKYVKTHQTRNTYWSSIQHVDCLVLQVCLYLTKQNVISSYEAISQLSRVLGEKAITFKYLNITEKSPLV